MQDTAISKGNGFQILKNVSILFKLLFVLLFLLMDICVIFAFFKTYFAGKLYFSSYIATLYICESYFFSGKLSRYALTAWCGIRLHFKPHSYNDCYNYQSFIFLSSFCSSDIILRIVSHFNVNKRNLDKWRMSTYIKCVIIHFF